jgi:general secretion pathway protein F
MPHFRYRALTHAGEVVLGEVDAPSREEVVRRIEYLGHLPIEAELATANALTRGLTRGRGRLRSGELTIFLRQLALLAGAGLTLEAALQTLGENASKGLTWFAGAIRSSISSGDSLAEALEQHPTIIEPAYVAMIRAGEASGKLDAVLRAVVEDRTRRDQLADRINSAIRYPLFLIGSAAAVLLFFLIYVVPQFDSVFKDLGGRLNGGAAFVLAVSGWLNANVDVFLGLCLALVLASWLVFSRRSARAAMIGAAAQIPGIAGPMRDRRAARIIGTLGLLVENGVTLPVALKIVRDVVSEPRHVAAVDRLNEQVRSGRRFADALAETELVPPLAVRMLRIGDETGDLPSIARHAAQFYEQKFGIGLDRLMGAIGPITIVIVSVVIGALIVSIMSALLSITELAT